MSARSSRSAIAGVALWMSLRRGDEDDDEFFAAAEQQEARSVERHPVAAVVANPAASASTAPVVEVPEEEWLVSGDLRLCRSTGEVWSGRRSVSLTPIELRVLGLLMTNGDRGVTREAMAAAAGYGRGAEWIAGNPEAVVRELRRKTGTRGHARRVRKERVMMYYFDNDDD